MRFHISISTLLFSIVTQVSAAPTPDGSLALVAGAAQFTFQYSTPNANSKNWIGLYHTTGGPDAEKQDQLSLRWKYVTNAKGTVQIDAPANARGKYKAYFLANDGYKWLAKPIEITASGQGSGNPDELRIMTFNLWHGGTQVNNYHEKQVKFIREQNLDIVGLQEATGAHAKRLGEALGWNYHQSDSENTAGIISRHPIVKKHSNIIDRSAGVQINLNSNSANSINFWSAHLNAYPYGPYEFCFEKKSAADVTATEASAGRTGQIKDLVEKTKAQRDSTSPFILVGDFNAPSHLDWTTATKGKHCGVSFEWPTSKIPVEAGLVDSYRKAHPDPATSSGDSWSPITPYNEDEKLPEPQDRIDFIYGTSKLEVLRSETKVAGTPMAMPNYKDNEWTSDHAAVITTYKMPKR
ncbi:DNase I-like protein [Melanomma pulvis-pyrius CBS 109.77]|uniref:DNase I-like protein n=1 Tax=Melanomma pulvis-pyrius CBS 109.77 TaxID=1314802 RepID=A0A6A6X1C9_9PLEO|nr:DNase I-like protein [Melanomma pulvis-pyrius CBS 109.77]